VLLRLAGLTAAVAVVAACGKMADLEPAPGQPLPMKPLMAGSTPTPNQLLTPPAYANPNRVDELITKSSPRKADRFDLPPPSGQAPDVTVQELENETTNKVGPVTPQ
jgi:hypothetical protein